MNGVSGVFLPGVQEEYRIPVKCGVCNRLLSMRRGHGYNAAAIGEKIQLRG